VLTLRAKNCRTGDVLDEEQVQAERKEDVLIALSQIASRFRTRVGESLSTVKSHDTPLAEATTPFLRSGKMRIRASPSLSRPKPSMQSSNSCTSPAWTPGVGRTPNETGQKSASGS
jgi:hypothetical protein